MGFLDLVTSLFKPRATPAPVLVPNPGRPATPPVPAPLSPAADVYPASEEDIRITVLTVWGEARGEPYEGKVAVAWTIRNRAAFAADYVRRWRRRHPNFGTGALQEVCLDPADFSCWNADDPNRAFLIGEKGMGPADLAALGECRRVVVGVMSGTIPDPTSGARHYFRNDIPVPVWAMGKAPSFKAGVHVFFNNIA